MSMSVAIVHSFSLLHNIPLYKQQSLSVLLLMGVLVVLHFVLLGTLPL